MEQTNLPLEEERPNAEPLVEQPPVTPEGTTTPEAVPAQEQAPVSPAGPETPIIPPPQPQQVPVYQPIATPPAKKKSKGFNWAITAFILAAFSLVISALTLLSQVKQNGWNLLPDADIPQSYTPSYNYRDNVAEDEILTSQEIIRKVNPSVVTISTILIAQGQTGGAVGTGIIYTDNGYILTNAHVVEGATSITVTDYEGKEYKASLVGADAETDTAIIKIDGKDLPAAEFGKASESVPGDRVIAFGSPYAEELHHTATEGIVSAHRKDVILSAWGERVDLIQHDASINRGNSGGPLVNAYGQVIGINTLKIPGDYDNLGFAISIDSVLPIAEELMSNGKVVRPGIGITGYTYQTEEVSGTYVESVVQGGAADQAGIRRGDIIIKANDTPISTINELKNEIRKNKIGDSISITYMRDGTVHTTTMALGELTEE